MVLTIEQATVEYEAAVATGDEDLEAIAEQALYEAEQLEQELAEQA